MKPMLAAKAKIENLRYPLMASPKIDGVRCLIIDGKAYSRTLKLIPNKFVQAVLGKPALNGLDGELCVGFPGAKDVYRKTVSGVMTEEEQPTFHFCVFDKFDLKLPFYRRFNKVLDITRGRNVDWMSTIPHTVVGNESELHEAEQDMLAAGYEGLMLRHPEGPYKFGRSTEKEGWLLKLKRFDDSEARILEVVELMHNKNEAKVNVLGKIERSSHKANKFGGDTMGSLRVKDIHTGVEFDIGTGFDAETRQEIWVNARQYVGKVVKYKFFAGGVKDKPRFPVFLGMRAKEDL